MAPEWLTTVWQLEALYKGEERSDDEHAWGLPWTWGI